MSDKKEKIISILTVSFSVIALVLVFLFMTLENIKYRNEAGMIKSWQEESFVLDYDDDSDTYDCFLIDEKEHVIVSNDNVHIRYLNQDFNEYVLELHNVYHTSSVNGMPYMSEEYFLYIYIGLEGVTYEY